MNPTSPPIDVMLIILAVIMAASVMDAAGGIEFLVRVAERVIRANPQYVTIVAPSPISSRNELDAPASVLQITTSATRVSA